MLPALQQIQPHGKRPAGNLQVLHQLVGFSTLPEAVLQEQVDHLRMRLPTRPYREVHIDATDVCRHGFRKPDFRNPTANKHRVVAQRGE